MIRTNQIQLALIAKDAVKSGKFFTAMFIKRTNGEIRLMVCRGGVKDNGGHLNYNPSEKGLITAWDRTKKMFRHINAEQLLLIRSAGKVYYAHPKNQIEGEAIFKYQKKRHV